MLRIPLFLATLAASLGATFYFGAADLWWINLFITTFAGLKLFLVNTFPIAHGVDGTRHVLGMPLRMFPFYLFILAIVIALYMIDAGSLGEAVQGRIHSFAAAAFLGWLMALLDWYLFSGQDTYYFDEQRDRAILRAQGKSEEEIEQQVANAHRRGLYGPSNKRS